MQCPEAPDEIDGMDADHFAAGKKLGSSEPGLWSRIYRLGRSIGKDNFAESDAELSVSVQPTGRLHLKDHATKQRSSWKNEMSMIE